MNLDNAYSSLPLLIRNKLKRILMSLLKQKLKNFYSQFIKPGNLVYDIGANEGDYAEIFLELGAKVICVEPQSEYVKKLKNRFKRNHKVKIIECGLGKKTEKLDFYISSFNSPNSSFSADFRKHSRYKNRKWDRVAKIQMTTLDQLIKKYGLPDFCKIDVEGYEWEVLCTLKKPISITSFEFLTELNQKSFQILSFLETLGKGKYNLCLGMDYKYRLKNWVNAEEIIFLLKQNQSKSWSGDIYVRF